LLVAWDGLVSCLSLDDRASSLLRWPALLLTLADRHEGGYREVLRYSLVHLQRRKAAMIKEIRLNAFDMNCVGHI